MRTETAQRLQKANAAIGRSAYTGASPEVRAELLIAKIQFRIEQMLTGQPPLTDEQRTDLCEFVSEVGVSA